MEEVITELKKQNPWWDNNAVLPKELGFGYERKFVRPMAKLALSNKLRRSVLLLGQRMVGKTTMLKQLIGHVLSNNTIPRHNVCYVDLGAIGTAVNDLRVIVDVFAKHTSNSKGRKLVLFDEVQIVEDWTLQLKVLTDHEANMDFVATNSVSAALNRKSKESGLGRILDFYVPPLLFCEYLEAKNKWPAGMPQDFAGIKNHQLSKHGIEKLNENFMDFMDHGTFPELLHKPNATSPIRLDTTEKAAFIGIPSTYGIRKSSELRELFLYIARNNGREITKKNFTSDTELSFVTVNSYLKYFQNSFTIRVVKRCGKNFARLKRDINSKYIMENTAQYSNLFGGLPKDDEALGHIVEACVFSQTEPYPGSATNYAHCRMNKRTYTADMIHLEYNLHDVIRLCGVKWSDSESTLKKAAKALLYFSRKKELKDGVYCTTKSTYRDDIDKTSKVKFLPAAQLCLMLSLERFESGIYSMGIDDNPFITPKQEQTSLL